MIDLLLSQLFQVLPSQTSLVVTIVFAILVSIGVMLIVVNKHVQVVMAVTLFLAIWLLVRDLGPNLYIAVVVLTLALAVQFLGTTIARAIDSELDWNIAAIMDEFLTDDDGGENRE